MKPQSLLPYKPTTLETKPARLNLALIGATILHGIGLLFSMFVVFLERYLHKGDDTGTGLESAYYYAMLGAVCSVFLCPLIMLVIAIFSRSRPRTRIVFLIASVAVSASQVAMFRFAIP